MKDTLLAIVTIDNKYLLRTYNLDGESVRMNLQKKQQQELAHVKCEETRIDNIIQMFEIPEG